MSRLFAYFARGCLVVVPVALTLYILIWVVRSLDNLLGVSIPGLGALLTISVTTVVGLLLSNVVGRHIAALIDRTFARLPFVKLLYGSLQDLMGAFFGEKKAFGRAVVVRLVPGAELRVLGFLTRDGLEPLALPGHVAVYVPQAYNIGGQLVCLPREQVEELAVPSSELLSFVMSGGVSGFGGKQAL